MFGLDRITTIIAGVVGAAALVAIGVLYVMLTNARADAVQAHADLQDTQRVLASTQAQVKTLEAAKAEQDRLNQWAADDRKAERTHLQAMNKTLQKTIDTYTAAKEAAAHAKPEEDGPAAHVLIDAIGQLRASASAVVRAGYGDEACAAAGGSGPGTDVCSSVASLVQIPQLQSEFAQVALRFGEAYESCAVKLITLKKRIETFNAEVAVFNASAQLANP